MTDRSGFKLEGEVNSTKRRIVLVFLSFVQSIAVYHGATLIWLPGKIPMIEGIAYPEFTDEILSAAGVFSSFGEFYRQIAFAFCTIHLFSSFLVIWSTNSSRKVLIRWGIFSSGIWAVLFWWVFSMTRILMVSTLTKIPGPIAVDDLAMRSPFFTAQRVIEIGLAILMISLLVLAVTVYRRERKGGESSS